MRRYKSALLLPIVLATTLLLSGCVRLGIDLEINKNQTVSGTMVYALSDSLAGLAGAGNSLSQGEIVDAKAKGVTVQSYKQDGFTGQKFVLNNVPFSAFKANSENRTLSIKQVGNQILVSGALDLTSSDGTANAESSAFAESMMASADVHVSIKFPYKVTSSNGDISTDKQTVTWRPKFGEKTDLNATMTIPNQSPVLIILIALLAACVIGGIIYFLRKKKPSINAAPNAGDAALPTQEV